MAIVSSMKYEISCTCTAQLCSILKNSFAHLTWIYDNVIKGMMSGNECRIQVECLITYGFIIFLFLSILGAFCRECVYVRIKVSRKRWNIADRTLLQEKLTQDLFNLDKIIILSSSYPSLRTQHVAQISPAFIRWSNLWME